MRNFFLLRLTLAGFAPVTATLLIVTKELVGLPTPPELWMNGQTFLSAARKVMVCLVVGFFSPTVWLKRKIKARQTKIKQGFPNALDPLLTSTEAGMGFDTATSKVGQTLGLVCPETSEQCLICQTEILASRDRTHAMNDMAVRMGVREVESFVQAITLSMDYGTSFAKALNVDALDMRETCEMKAIEQANKLPALFLIPLGPTIIRYMDAFGDK